MHQQRKNYGVPYGMSSRLILLVSIVSILVGCTSPTRIDRMTISEQEAGKYTVSTPLANSISVNSVTGGGEMNPLWTPEIENNEFKQALIDSLALAQLLASDAKGPYTLNAKMVRVDHSPPKTGITVTSVIHYTLVHSLDGKELFNEAISNSYDARFDEAFLYVERLKLAHEKSIRNDITQLINRLYKLEIKPN